MREPMRTCGAGGCAESLGIDRLCNRQEELTQHEGANAQTQPQHAAKGNQVTAAKLERFSYTPAQSPAKRGQQLQAKSQPRVSSVRRSQGQGKGNSTRDRAYKQQRVKAPSLSHPLKLESLQRENYR